jgi:hypothetical protein
MEVQLDQYQLDNLIVLDIMMNTLSAAEKLVFGPYEGRKYAYYDEGNSSGWKKLPQLVKELQIQKECLQSMIKLYERNSNKKSFIFPKNLTKVEIIADLLILRDATIIKYKDNKYTNIYNDIIKVINSEECDRYSIDQIYSNENNDYVMDEEKVKNQAKIILEAKNRMIERDKEFEENLKENNGKINYEANLNFQKYPFTKSDYYKNFYENAYNNIK